MDAVKPLGELLVAEKIISTEHLEQALHRQKKEGGLLGEILLGEANLSEEAIFAILARQLKVEYFPLKNVVVDPKAIACLPARMAVYYQCFPVAYADDLLTVALSRPQDIYVLDSLRLIIAKPIKTVLTSEEDIHKAIRRCYGVGTETVEQMLGGSNGDGMRSPAEIIVQDIEEPQIAASVSKLVNQILLEAYHQRATDIHIECYEEEVIIRYRIDGLLYPAKVSRHLRHFKEALHSRIKIMSNLNIAETRLPQDGRFTVKIGEINLDLRVSFLPTPWGESAVIRLLNTRRLYNMQELGLVTADLEILEGLIHKSHGIIFVTGPTGSGKTTTLYSCLSRIHTSEKKILTIEDPIEYQLSGITQIQISPVIGLTFAAGLRSMLRHDPDIMMVGEVRDFETAQIAIQVALTGHLIFSTIHTNDAASAVTRLLDMGLEPYLIASSVECFIAQRLVRLICPYCKEQDIKGCETCQKTGYYGREAIYEFLIMTDEIREMVIKRASAQQIKEAAVKNGMRTLRQAGIEKVSRGLTTAAEVMRVT